MALKDLGNGEKQIDPKALAQSVIDIPAAPSEGSIPGSGTALLWMISNIVSEFPAWGTKIKERDSLLRAFIGEESLFASALGIVALSNAAYRWTMTGPPRTVARSKEMLDSADQGAGYQSLIIKTSIDLCTQDHGAFWELPRLDNESPDSPVLTVNHLDSARCWHTGNPLAPVVYQDRFGRNHLLRWWNVVTLREMPAPVEGRYGLQYCALTRLLLAAQILRNIAIYKEEKTGGRHNRAIHFVSGVTKIDIEDAVERHRVFSDAQGLQRFSNPVVVGAVDPKAKIDVATLELAALPDNFNEETTFKQYVAQIAMALGRDYQDFAPLPGGNLGTSAQSEILHMKARGKGPALFMSLITRALNNFVLPRNVEFAFEEQDLDAEREEALIRKTRVETRKLQVELGEITEEESRQMAVDAGDIPQDIFEASGSVDITEDVEVESGEHLEKEDGNRSSWSRAGFGVYDASAGV